MESIFGEGGSRGQQLSGGQGGEVLGSLSAKFMVPTLSGGVFSGEVSVIGLESCSK